MGDVRSDASASAGSRGCRDEGAVAQADHGGELAGVSGEGLGMVWEASIWSDVTAVSLVRGNVTIRWLVGLISDRWLTKSGEGIPREKDNAAFCIGIYGHWVFVT